jgi:hypothetical protein
MHLLFNIRAINKTKRILVAYLFPSRYNNQRVHAQQKENKVQKRRGKIQKKMTAILLLFFKVQPCPR